MDPRPGCSHPQGRRPQVVYTAITGGKDELVEPDAVAADWDYVCFSDNPELRSATWEIRPLELVDADPVRGARRPKVLAHRYLPEYSTSLWIDGNMRLRGSPEGFARRYLGVEPLVLFRHPDGERGVYEEGRVCIERDKDDPDAIHAQLERYRDEGIPATHLVSPTGVMLRRHHDDSVAALCEAWWSEIGSGSNRDQLALAAVMWRRRPRFTEVDADLRDNPLVLWRPHLTPERSADRLARAGASPAIGQAPGRVAARPDSSVATQGMRPFWENVIEPLLDAAGARTVVEVGAESGETTAPLMGWAQRSGAVVHSIDPVPGIDVAAWEREHGERFRFHEARSLDVLGEIDSIDAVLIDGDHNWYTVHSELTLLAERARAAGRPLPLVIAHDAGWPYARRDMYYDPASVPDEHRHEVAKAGVHPGRSELETPGFNWWRWHATREGGERNGVLTAIEDFTREHPTPCELITIEGMGGLAVLADRDRLEASAQLSKALERLGSPEVLREQVSAVEEARIRTEIRLRAAEVEKNAETEELNRRRLELKETVSALERQLADARRRLESWARAARDIERSRTWRLGNFLIRALRLLTFRRPVPSQGPGELAAAIEAARDREGAASAEDARDRGL